MEMVVVVMCVSAFVCQCTCLMCVCVIIEIPSLHGVMFCQYVLRHKRISRYFQ